MKIEKERDCIRVTFHSERKPDDLMSFYDALTNRVDGIYFPSDIRNGKDGICINIRSRETLQTYMEKNIFRMEQFTGLLKALKKIILDLSDAGYKMENCVWDVDTVFIGGGPEDIEVLYLPETEISAEPANRFTDLLAVTSLHVFESRDEAIDAMADVIRSIDRWEKGEGDYPLTEEVFESGILLLESYLSGGNRLKKEFELLKLSVKGLLSGKNNNQNKRERNGRTDGKYGGSGLERKKQEIAELYKQKENKSVKGIYRESVIHDVIKPKSGNKLPESFELHRSGNMKGGTGKAEGHISAEGIRYRNGNRSRNKGNISKRIINLDDLKDKGSSERIEQKRQVVKSNLENLPEPETIGRNQLSGETGSGFLTVSRKHIFLYRTSKGYAIIDAGSKNGTYLNGQKLDKGLVYRLKKGDVIGFSHPLLGVKFG